MNESKWLGGGGGGTTYIYMYKQHSIINTSNFNVEFKLLTHNRYLVLNGHFACPPKSPIFFMQLVTTSPIIKYKHILSMVCVVDLDL